MENNLRGLRADHDLTQRQLADAVNVSRQTINALETGRYNPSLDLAFHLAAFFRLTIEEIFRHDPHCPDRPAAPQPACAMPDDRLPAPAPPA